MPMLRKTSEGGYNVKGICPHPSCKKEVFDHIFNLDDCFGLNFECPHCGATLFLDISQGGRGYTNTEMRLVLPVEEELAPNGFSPDTPTQQNPFKGKFQKPIQKHCAINNTPDENECIQCDECNHTDNCGKVAA